MLGMQEKKQFLRMALSCLRNANEKDPLLKTVNGEKPMPTDDEILAIKNGLASGEIDDSILKKFFPIAYDGVSKYGIFGFYFSEHNKSLRHIAKQDKLADLADWCRAYPAKVVERKGSEFTVERSDGKVLKTTVFKYDSADLLDEKKLEKDSYVALHRGKIHMVLSKDEFEKASSFYKEFQKESQI